MSLIRYMICKYFLPFCGLCIHFIAGILWKIKSFNCMESILSIFIFFTCIFLFISKKVLPTSKSWRLTPLFFYEGFIVLTLISRFIIHFKYSFMYIMNKRYNFTLLPVDIQLSQHYLLKRPFFPHWIVLVSN